MDIFKGGSSPSSEPLLPVDVREKGASGTRSTNDDGQRPKPASKMACARRTVMAMLLCMLVLLGLAFASSPRPPCHNGATDQQTATATSESFADMLKSASPASLNELLHRYFPGRFQDGVFESEHKAMEAVHQANAALATSIVQLAKRDGANSTTSGASSTPTPTETTTSEPPVDSTTSTAVPPSSTSSPSSSSSTSVAPPSSSSVPPASTSSSRSTIPPSTSTSSSPPGTSRSSTGTTLSSSRPGTASSSSPQTLPSSSIPGDTTLTTSTMPPATTTSPPQTSKPVVTTLTSTSPNGVVVTVIATTYVPGDASATSTPSSTRSPSLQNLAAGRRSGGSILAGAVALAMFVLTV